MEPESWDGVMTGRAFDRRRFSSAYRDFLAGWAAGAQYLREAQVLVDLLAPRPGERWLDVGCGTGALTARLRSAGVDCYGIDCGAWRPSDGRGFVRGLAEALPFADSTFDAAVLVHVIGHVAAVEPVLAECRRVLRPGGLIGVVTPQLAAQKAWLRHCRRRGIPFETEPTLLRYVSSTWLDQSLARAGFTIRARTEYGRRPPGGGPPELVARVATA